MCLGYTKTLNHQRFTCYRYDLKSEKVRYNSSELSDLKSDDTSEQLWVKLQVKGSPYLCLGSFYKPLKQTEDKCLIHLLNFIHWIVRQSENSKMWPVGNSTWEALVRHVTQSKQIHRTQNDGIWHTSQLHQINTWSFLHHQQLPCEECRGNIWYIWPWNNVYRS